MPELELRPARPEEFDAIAGLLSVAGLPVEDLNVTMLDAFVVATDLPVNALAGTDITLDERLEYLLRLTCPPSVPSNGVSSYRAVSSCETIWQVFRSATLSTGRPLRAAAAPSRPQMFPNVDSGSTGSPGTPPCGAPHGTDAVAKGTR